MCQLIRGLGLMPKKFDGGVWIRVVIDIKNIESGGLRSKLQGMVRNIASIFLFVWMNLWLIHVVPIIS